MQDTICSELNITPAQMLDWISIHQRVMAIQYYVQDGLVLSFKFLLD